MEARAAALADYVEASTHAIERTLLQWRPGQLPWLTVIAGSYLRRLAMLQWRPGQLPWLTRSLRGSLKPVLCASMEARAAALAD